MAMTINSRLLDLFLCTSRLFRRTDVFVFAGNETVAMLFDPGEM